MTTLTDQELVEAFQERLDFNRRALVDLKTMTSKLQATNRKLQESEALKGHFLSNIRNEINNPLAVIIGLADKLMSPGGDVDEPRQLARIIYSEAFRLDFQLENIFMAAELEAGEATPDLARVNVVGVVNGILEQLPFLDAEKQVTIAQDLPESLFVVTDARKVHVAVLNLLANAVEYSPQGGEIEVAVALEEGQLKVTVRDHGCGIAPEDQEAVFDRFWQRESGSTKGHRGHGLGLSVTCALVELLGGTVVLDSAPGQGCSMTVSVPAADGGAKDLAGGENVFLFDGCELF